MVNRKRGPYKKKQAPTITVGSRVSEDLYNWIRDFVKERDTNITCFLASLIQTARENNGDLVTKAQLVKPNESVSDPQLVKQVENLKEELEESYKEISSLWDKIHEKEEEISKLKDLASKKDLYIREVERTRELAIKKYCENAFFPNKEQFKIQVQKP